MKKLFLIIIRFYQTAISPYRPACCRYYPTCSAYAYTAITRFGAMRGGLLAFLRIMRCHPFHPGGFDPVPETWDEAVASMRKKRKSECVKLHMDEKRL